MICQRIFEGALTYRGEAGRTCRRLRRWILKWADPLVSWEVNGRRLRLPLSHKLPFYRREFPVYSANLQRLASALRRQTKHLVLIDVGANVGDSLALVGIEAGDRSLLVEGDPYYYKLLEENTAGLPNVVCVAAMLSDRMGEERVHLVSTDGTGRVVRAGSAAPLASVLTLDRIVSERPQFQHCQLLKVDVDGYDFRVLRGGEQFIRQTQPVLFFEQDPRLLQGAGEQPDAIWPWLASCGYSHLFVYDNFGFWLGAFPITNITLLEQLNSYALQRTGSYYDVTAFAPRHGELHRQFAAAEALFYRGLTER
jgi:FkbM family methyltransferase